MGFGLGFGLRENSVVISIGVGVPFRVEIGRKAPVLVVVWLQRGKCKFLSHRAAIFCGYYSAFTGMHRVLQVACWLKRLHLHAMSRYGGDRLDHATVITVCNALYLHNAPFSHQFSSCTHARQ
jgi:hypothetical protein